MALSKKQWQEQHGFNDEDMDLIDSLLKSSGGKITKVFNKPTKDVFNDHNSIDKKTI